MRWEVGVPKIKGQFTKIIAEQIEVLIKEYLPYPQYDQLDWLKNNKEFVLPEIYSKKMMGKKTIFIDVFKKVGMYKE